EIKNDNKRAKLTKILFDAQKGINAIDSLSQTINLAKGHKQRPGIGVCFIQHDSAMLIVKNLCPSVSSVVGKDLCEFVESGMVVSLS
ncbi:MAG: hypothetical protein II447_05380, partial [Bacteroidaceae bacterium]|nr:hypothetical protein [Bacteroidaceae bacterium]